MAAITGGREMDAGAMIEYFRPLLTWLERRGAGFIQLRLGPNRVGPLGLFQPIADGLKFFFKEDILPPFVHKPTYVLAPIVSLAAALTAFAVIPFGSKLRLLGIEVPLRIVDVDVDAIRDSRRIQARNIDLDLDLDREIKTR